MSKKFVLNAESFSAGARVWVHELAEELRSIGHEAKVNDWIHYERYDVALIPAGQAHIEDMRKANPNMLIGLIDPKTSSIENAKRADFFIVSSVEQRDLFLKYNQNIFIYYPFPKTPVVKKQHKMKSKYILGYHGNKIHLHSFFPDLKNALESLGKRYELELRCVYNIEKEGPWELGKPRESFLSVKHVQWSPENIVSALSDVDVGLVPATIPIKGSERIKEKSTYSNKAYLTDRNDYLTRYKYSTNPGRLYVFSQLGIPVVAGFYPSACQFIFDGKSGFLAHSAEGWYYAIDRLLSDPKLRTSCAKNLKDTISKIGEQRVLAKNLIEFIEKLGRPATHSDSGIHLANGSYSISLFNLLLMRERIKNKLFWPIKRRIKKLMSKRK